MEEKKGRKIRIRCNRGSLGGGAQEKHGEEALDAERERSYKRPNSSGGGRKGRERRWHHSSSGIDSTTGKDNGYNVITERRKPKGSG